MKRFIVVFAVTILGIAAFSSISSAAGFRLPDQDAAAMGMGGAFVGQADNPSAVWYNPAGITQLDGTRVSVGVLAIYPVMNHENMNGTTDVSERNVFLPVQLFATGKVNDRVSLGLGITSPFGLSTNWSDTSSTKYVATLSRVKTIDINPNIAYKINDNLSVAAGIDYMILQATMSKVVRVVLPGPIDLGDHNFRLNGDGHGWGMNAAIKYSPSETLNAGLAYRNRVKVSVDGTADLTGGPAATSGSVSTDITLPDLVQFGISYKAFDQFTINTDLDYTMWSTYDRLVIQSDVASFNATDEKNWKNTWTIRLGGQYQLSDQWKLRAGYVYDQSPVPSDRFDTRVPDADRQGITIGTGYTSGNITIDASYMYLHFKNRTISNSIAGQPSGSAPIVSLDGTYKSVAHLAGITIAYKF